MNSLMLCCRVTMVATLSPPTPSPLDLSRTLLHALGVRLRVQGQERVPNQGPLIVVSNHRSVLDAPLLMATVGQPVHFACHHYLGQVPGMRDLVQALGALPLDSAPRGQRRFLRQATRTLADQRAIGIFPEGAVPMVKASSPRQVNRFQRGFAHLALRSPLPDLSVVPCAVVSRRESSNAVLPLRVLSMFDPSEPLFRQPGWHPMVLYRDVEVRVGRPVRLDQRLRDRYSGRSAAKLITDLTQSCQEEVANLLREGDPAG